MNLIEQLGGYEKALQFLKSEKNSLEIDPVFYLDGQEILVDALDDALLEYRRANNIFEVGDKVVLAQFHSLDTVHEIKRIENLTPHIKGSETTYFLENSLGCWSFQIKHATDGEIKAGKRLEVV